MRFFHTEFVREYVWAFGVAPDAGFLEAYDALCERLYFGDRGSEEAVSQVGRKGRYPRTYDFNDARLLGPKGKADRILSQAARALARWRTRRPSSG